MSLILTIYFFILGLCFGSFALATAWRIKKHKDFVRDTSECEHCKHKLAAKDLIPLFSWLSLGGKCRYCHKKLSRLMPLAELLGGVALAASFVWWPYEFNSALLVARFALWCVALILLLILFLYDLQWYILPNKVIYPLWGVSAAYFVTFFISKPTPYTLALLAGAIFIASGLFYAIYELSRGAWIGFGDVRLGFAIALLVMQPIQAGLVLFIASFVGMVVTIPLLVTGNKKLSSKIPFGPLLILATFITVLFGQAIASWYSTQILML
ncbi:prepilin peptidase [bacterium]|nr:prepilin peptidase [bacterium]NBX97470.1 prepilin peptidase [bacterium]NDC95369.1 prepilin peptidase [bacterium]NDD83843.1 prepilin peptidase [bacterium]NDG31574.1 prepilin peptidase [bacterium]